VPHLEHDGILIVVVIGLVTLSAPSCSHSEMVYDPSLGEASLADS
jgi:hypothetical protein